MTYFTPGKIIKTFAAKNAQEVIIRYPKWEDLDEMISFINAISYEDTFTTFSGETVYKDGEMHYLSEMIKSMEFGNGVYLACFVGTRLIGSATVIRDTTHRKRSYHIGIFGITIDKALRSQGIGEILSLALFEEAKNKINGLKLFTLNVYSPNNIALNLYKKLGFSEFGRLKRGIWYKGQYVEEVKMYKEI